MENKLNKKFFKKKNITYIMQLGYNLFFAFFRDYFHFAVGFVQSVEIEKRLEPFQIGENIRQKKIQQRPKFR